MGHHKECPICQNKSPQKRVYCSDKCLVKAEKLATREGKLLENQRENLFFAYQNEKMRRELLVSKELYPDIQEHPICEYIDIVDEGMELKKKKLLTSYKRKKRNLYSTKNLQRVV